MLALVVAIVLAIGDQWSKEWVRRTFDLHDSRPVVEGFFQLTYLRNTGAAWGMFRGGNLWLAMLSAAALAAIIVFRRSFLKPDLSHRIALGLLCGGILGNLLDRVRLGYVTDFLGFRFGAYEFPAFNFADAGITVGVSLLMASSIWDEWQARRRRPPGAVARDG